MCTTDSGPNPNEPCVFPFTYSDGKTHHTCTFDYGNPTDPAWCSTKVRIKKLLICTKLDLIRPITQPDRTLFFLIFTYLWGIFHWSFRNYGSNAAIYNSFKPETNKGEFRLYFELFEKKLQGAPPLRNIKNKQNFFDIFTMDAPPGVPGVSKIRKNQRINNLMCFCANI